MTTTPNIDLSIAFSNGQQAAIVGHCIVSEEFFLKSKAYIKPEWLTSDLMVSHIYRELIRFYENYKMMPRSGDELFAEPFFKSQSPKDYEKYQSTYNYCILEANKFSLEILRPKITHFVRTQAAREQAKALIVDMNSHNYEKAVQAAQGIVKAWSQIDFDANPYVDFSDTVSLWTKEDAQNVATFSTGSKTLDFMLGGGIFPGGNLAVLAPTFTGKSRFLITLARHALVQGKKVLFMIHEDNPEKVKRRVIASVCAIGPQYIEMALKNKIKEIEIEKTNWVITGWDDKTAEDFKQYIIQELELAKKILMENFIFIPWQKAGKMFVEDVVDEIKRVSLEQKTKTGRGFDLIINDYPALLRSKTRHEHERARLSYVYQCFNDVAAELNTFCAYAVQVNRAAAKEMKNGEAEKVLGLEDVSESYQIAMNAMAAISLNRSEEDAKKNILRIAVVKARDVGEHSVLCTRTAYNEGSLYGDSIMYKDHGKMLITGLSCYKEQTYSLASTSIIESNLLEIEKNVSQTELVLRSTAPLIVKKIKGLPIIE